MRLRDEKHQEQLEEVKRQLEAIKLKTQRNPSTNEDDIQLPEAAGMDNSTISSAPDFEAPVSVSALSVGAAADGASEANLEQVEANLAPEPAADDVSSASRIENSRNNGEDNNSVQPVEASHGQKGRANPGLNALHVTDLADSGDEKAESETKSNTAVLSSDISALSQFNSRPAQQVQTPVSHYHYRRPRPSYRDHASTPSLGSNYSHHKTAPMPVHSASSSFHHSRHQHTQRLKRELGHGHHHMTTPRKVPHPHSSANLTAGGSSVGRVSMTQPLRTSMNTHNHSASSGLQRLPPQPLIQAPNMSLPSPAPQAPARHIHQPHAPKPFRREQPPIPNFSASTLQRSPVQHFRSKPRHEPTSLVSSTRSSETQTTTAPPPALSESGTQTFEESVGASTQTPITEVVRRHDVSVGPGHGDQEPPISDNLADTSAVRQHDASVGTERRDQEAPISGQPTDTSVVEYRENKSSSSQNQARPSPRRHRGQSRQHSTSPSSRSRRRHLADEDLDVDTKHERRRDNKTHNSERGAKRHHKHESDRRDRDVRERKSPTRRRVRSLESQRRRDHDQRPHTHHSHRSRRRDDTERRRRDEPAASTRVTANSASSRGRYHTFDAEDEQSLFSSEEEFVRPRRRRLGLAPSPSTRLNSRQDPYQPALSEPSDWSRTYPMHTASALHPRQFTTSRGFVASDHVSQTPRESKTTASDVAAAVAAANGKKGDGKDKEADDDVALLVYI